MSLRIPLFVLALTSGCTCGPVYEGVTVPQTIDQLVTRNGFVYATGNFRPGPTTRGDASLTVVDAESLCLKKQDAIHPYKDLARAQYREWSSGVIGPWLLGADATGLIGAHSSAALTRPDAGLAREDQKPMQWVRLDLADPFRPTEGTTKELPGTESGAVVSSRALTDDVALFTVVLSAVSANPAAPGSLLGLVRLSTLEHSVLPHPSTDPFAPLAFDAPRQLVYLLSPDAALPGQVTLVALRFDAQSLKLTEVSRTPLTGLSLPRALAVLPDGTLALADGGSSGKPPVLRFYFLDADGRATPSWVLGVGGTEALSHLAVRPPGVLLAARGKTLLTFDAAIATGASATPLATLALAAAPRGLVPFTSPSEPNASLVVVPMGNAGMLLVEIGATALTARRGFVHGWNTNGIDTRTFGTY